MRGEGGDLNLVGGAWLFVAAGGCAHGAFVGSMAGQARQAIERNALSCYMSMFAMPSISFTCLHMCSLTWTKLA